VQVHPTGRWLVLDGKRQRLTATCRTTYWSRRHHELVGDDPGHLTSPTVTPTTSPPRPPTRREPRTSSTSPSPTTRPSPRSPSSTRSTPPPTVPMDGTAPARPRRTPATALPSPQRRWHRGPPPRTPGGTARRSATAHRASRPASGTTGWMLTCPRAASPRQHLLVFVRH